MPAHKHAELMMEYAKDALLSEAPWENWEYFYNDTWRSLAGTPAWGPDMPYRRKPKVVSHRLYEYIGGYGSDGYRCILNTDAFFKEAQIKNVEKAPGFVRWVTPWIETEV